MISVFLPSFNKGGFVLDAIKSVLDQTYQDFELWILENSTDGKTREVVRGFLNSLEKTNREKIRYHEITISEKDRKLFYPTAKLLNTFYQVANGEYIAYISDDDIFDLTTFEECYNFFIKNPEKEYAWFSIDVLKQDGSAFHKVSDKKADGIVYKGYFNCQLDGGQVIHTKKILDKVTKPYLSETWVNSSCCDGLFLEKLGGVSACYPIESPLAKVSHRRLENSTFTNNTI